MLETFFLTLNQVGTLLIYIAVGYLLRRWNKLPEHAGQILSLLCVMLFTPAYNIVNLSNSLHLEVIVEKLQLAGWGCICVAIVILLGRLLAKPMSHTPMEKSSLTYAFTFPNYGYFGYPVVEGVFGSAMLGDFMVFAIPIALFCSSYGYAIFQNDKRFSLLRLLKTPLVLSLLIGAAIGLSGIALPPFVTTVLTGASNCMSPCSMLLGGFMLGKFPLKQLFSGVRPYLLTAIRMLGIPGVLGAALFVCGVRGDYLFWPLVFACLPLGLNLVVYPESLGYEKEAADNAKLCFISYLLALGLLPCIFAVLTQLCY